MKRGFNIDAVGTITEKHITEGVSEKNKKWRNVSITVSAPNMGKGISHVDFVTFDTILDAVNVDDTIHIIGRLEVYKDYDYGQVQFKLQGKPTSCVIIKNYRQQNLENITKKANCEKQF